mmetsp:Transcript_52470/g.151162  ORF Transcript_52470/g.151162 Transcript_52470/m.151162 type:complete len:542 (+) Transcript_52470:77-1702(+)
MTMMLNAQRIIIRLGLCVSSIFFFLGFPCSSSPLPQALFRSTCAGYFVGNLGANFQTPGGVARKRWFRFAMVSNSLASLVISKWWCMGFPEWLIIQVLEASFQAAGGVFLLERDVFWHPTLTLAFSIAFYVCRSQSQTMELFWARVWITVGAASVLALVVGMGSAGFLTVEALRRKMEALYKVLVADINFEPTGAPADILFASQRSSHGSSSSSVPTDSSVVSDGNVSRMARCPFDDVVLHTKVGRGSFGIVYSATQGRTQPVAVKAIPPRFEVRPKSSPLREARVAVDLVHPCVVRTYRYAARYVPRLQDSLGGDDAEEEECGEVISDAEELRRAEASLKPLEMWILQEWCDRGDLTHFCRRPMIEGDDVLEACQIVADIARGGEFLHERDIIHGDLTANNVLVASTSSTHRGYICKVCDFGLARVLEGHTSAIFTTTMGTVTHMPPELFQAEQGAIRLSKKADVYAAGVLLWQVVMGKPPFGDMHAAQIILFVANGGRLELDERAPPGLHALYGRCLLQDPRERPCFSEVCADILKLSS